MRVANNHSLHVLKKGYFALLYVLLLRKEAHIVVGDLKATFHSCSRSRIKNRVRGGAGFALSQTVRASSEHIDFFIYCGRFQNVVFE